jgi:hypothetical protein
MKRHRLAPADWICRCRSGERTFPHRLPRHCEQDAARLHGQAPGCAEVGQRRHVACGEVFHTSKWHSLECLSCGVTVAKTSKTYGASCDRDEEVVVCTHSEWLRRFGACANCSVWCEFYLDAKCVDCYQGAGEVELVRYDDRVYDHAVANTNAWFSTLAECYDPVTFDAPEPEPVVIDWDAEYDAYMDYDDPVLHALGWFSSPLPVVTPKAKRGKRGGVRRNNTFSNGRCYLSLVSRSARQSCNLGLFPSISEVAEVINGKPLSGEAKTLVRKGDLLHVTKGGDFSLCQTQINVLWSCDSEMKCGGFHSESFLDASEYFSNEVVSRLLGAPPVSHADVADIEEDAEMILAALNDPLPIIAEPPVVERERKVQGGGTCWMAFTSAGLKIPGVSISKPETWTKVTVSDILAAWLSAKSRFTFLKLWVHWEEQDDGDYHVIGVKMAQKQPKEHEEMSAVVKQWEIHRMVGKAAQSPLDVAAQTLNNPTVSMNIQNAMVDKVIDANARAKRLCPWAIPVENQHHAAECKVPWSITNADVHDHPIHAAIRRMQCYETLPGLIKSDFTCVSMASANFEMLNAGLKMKNRKYVGQCVNPIIDVKDHGRYAATGTVPAAVFELPEVTTPTVIFHDSGHYLNAQFLWSYFRKNPKVRFAIITHVFPLASILVDTSPDPTLYQFQFSEDRKTMIYIPEGHVGGKYEQPADPGLLLARSIKDVEQEAILYGGIVESRLNSHVQVWSRYQTEVPKCVALTMPDMMPLRRLKRSAPKKMPLVKTEYYVKLFEYAKTLEMSEKDAWGKMRQFTVDNHMYFPLGVKQMLIDCVMEAVQIPLTADLQSKYYGDISSMMFYKTVGHLIRLKHKWVDAKFAARAQRMVNEPPPLHLLPALDLIIKYSSTAVYGVTWKIPSELRESFVHTFARWVCRLMKTKEKVDMNLVSLDGTVMWDFVSLTSKTEKVIGIDIIKTTQARDYMRNFEGVDWKPPKPIVYDFVRTVPPVHEVFGDGGSVVHDMDECMSVSDDSDFARPLLDDERERLSKFDDDYRHLPNLFGPTWGEFHGRWPNLTQDHYVDYCEARRGVLNRWPEKEQEDDRVRNINTLQRMVKRESRRHDRGKHENQPKALPPIEEDEEMTVPIEVEAMQMAVTDLLRHPEVPKGKQVDAGVEGPTVPSGSDVTVEQMMREAYEPQGVLSPPDNKGGYSDRPFPWIEANNDWEKIRKARKPIPYHPQGHGVALWDSLFPSTVDKRIHSVPFPKPLFYPDVKYPTGDCLLVSCSQLMNKPAPTLLLVASRAIEAQDITGDILSVGVLDTLGCHYLVKFEIYNRRQELIAEHGVKSSTILKIQWHDNHFRALGVVSKGMIIRKPLRAEASLAASELIDELTALPTISWSNWSPSVTRAQQYVRAVIEKTTGTLMSEINLETLKSWENMCDAMKNTGPRQLAMVVGSAGCRKSSAIQKVLQKKKYQRDLAFAVTIPTNTLAIDWRDKLGVRDKDPRTMRATPGRYVSTFERNIADGNWGSVMFMDEDKYPKGYVDLLAALYPWVTHFVFMCDPLQTEWHEPNASCHLNDPAMLGNASFLFPLASQYLLGTWRLPPNIASFFRLPTWNKGNGSFHFADSTLHSWKDLHPFLANRYDEVGLRALWSRRVSFFAAQASKQWADALGEGDSVTFSGSQGLSMELAIIEIDYRVIRLADPRILFTAMTRASEVIFICNFTTDGVNLQMLDTNPILKQLFRYRENYRPGDVVKINSDWTVDMMTLMNNVPKSLDIVLAGPPSKCRNRDFVAKFYPSRLWENFIDPDVIRGGARLDVESDVYRDQPDFKPFILTYQHEFVREAEVREATVKGVNIKTHLPPVNENQLIEENDSDVIERYQRELSWKGIFSEQMPDTPLNFWDSGMRRKKFLTRRRHELGSMPRHKKEVILSRELKTIRADLEKFKPHALSWGANQRADDKPSFAAGVAQRIRRMTYYENKDERDRGVPYGKAMWSALKKYLGWTNRIVFDQMLYEDCLILFEMRRAERSEKLQKMSLNRASPDYVDFLTAKTQWKLKSREAKPASPLQTLLVRSDRVLFRDGPLGIYLLEMIERYCPRYLYLHARKTFDDMALWCAQAPDTDTFQMCDITGFDSTIRGADLTLERELMEHFNVPANHIAAYEEDKLDFHTSTIHFGIMRFSGEIFTWLFNTMHTLARECLKFDCQPGDYIAVSGDDVLKWGVRPVSEAWHRWEHEDPSIEKRYEDKRGEFCSFLIYRGHIFKDPKILYRRLKGQIERGKADDVALGYFDLFSVQYKLADLLFDVMTENELEYCAAINRIMFNWRKVADSTIHLPWHSLRVDFRDDAPGTREDAVLELETMFGMSDPRELSPILDADIIATALPGVSFDYLWDD